MCRSGSCSSPSDPASPLRHLADSFDSLRDHLTLIDSPLDFDFDDIQSTLDVGIEVITEALWPDNLQTAP
jgi:hypothetical protein